MKKLFILFLSSFIFCTTQVTFGQSKYNIDSLIKIINTSTDTAFFSHWAYELGTSSEIDKFEKSVLTNAFLARTEMLSDEINNARFKFRKSIFLTIDGNYTESIRLINQVIPIFEKLDSAYLMASYNTSGNMMARLGDTKKGISNLRKAISISNKVNLTHEKKLITQINNYLVLGNIYFTIKKIDSADKYFKIAYELSLQQKNKSSKERGFALLNLAGVDHERKLFRKSLARNQEALAFSNGIFKDIECTAFGKMGTDYMALGMYDSALYFLNIAEQKGIAYHLSREHLRTLDRKVTYYKKINDHKSALKTLELRNKTKEQIDSIDKSARVDFMVGQTKLEEQKESQFKISQEKVKQRNLQIAIISILGLMLLLGLIAYFLYQRKQLRQQLEKDRVEKEMIKSQIRAINSQMNPHFVFNSLNSIQELIVLNDIRNSNIYLGKFADLMRRTLEYSQEDEIYLHQELDVLKLYLDLEQKRFGEELQIEINNQLDEHELKEIKVPSMLFQPYVENALKHGLLHKQGAKNLKISISKPNNQLQVIIEDNGIGRAKSAELNERSPKNHKSYALNANQNRLDLIKYSTGRQIDLEFIDIENGGGTKVVFNFSSI